MAAAEPSADLYRLNPVIGDLEPVWAEIPANVTDDEYVLPAQRFRDPGINEQRCDYTLFPASEQAVWRLVKAVVQRAGIAANVTPHSLRHAYCDHVALQVAQQAMGHANLATTELYLGTPTLDEIALKMRGVTLAADPQPERTFQVPEIGAAKPEEAPTGIEPVYTALQAAA